jgi:hypothetical protein
MMRFQNTTFAFCVIFIFVLMSGCAPTTKRPDINQAAVELEAEKQREFALKEAFNNQQRLHNVAWPILEAGRPLCVDKNRWAIGMKFANKNDIPKEMQDAAVSLFDMGENLQVIAVADESPAAAAGMKVDDVIISVNGESAPVGKEATQRMTDLMKKQTKDGKDIELVIHQEGINKTLSITPVEVCKYPVLIVENDAVNAMANGNQILIFQGMMDFSRTDHELAVVVAHELAHNSMRHIEAQKTNFFIGFLFDILITGLTGVDVGIRNAAARAYSKDFEAEADYVGMYIMARNGSEIDDAPEFWRRMGIKHPGSIQQNHAASHPSTPERFVALEETIKEIKLKQETDQELMPNIDEDARGSREPPPSQASQLGFGS